MIHLRVSAEVAPVTSALLLESIGRILATNRLCTLATVNGDQTPHASTAFFAPIDALGVAIWTSPKTRHSVNAEANPAAALTVFDSTQPFGQPLLGLQASGTLRRCNSTAAIRAFSQYAKRFVSFRALASSVDEMHRVFESRFYSFAINEVKVLDEAAFGSENYVTGVVE